jgi:hypothetical protein
MLLSTRIVQKKEQPAFALEKFGIADLSALPVDWNPSTHYTHGCNGRPLTPSPLFERSEHWTEEGAWIVKTFAPAPPTPYSSPPSSPTVLCVGDNLLVFDDTRTNFTVALDEKKVGDLPLKHLPRVLAKLIKKTKELRKENDVLRKEKAALQNKVLALEKPRSAV